MLAVAVVLLIVAVIWVLAYVRAPLWLFTVVAAAFLAAATYLCPIQTTSLAIAWSVFLVLAIAFNVPALRRSVISNHLFEPFRRAMPAMSTTEREALEAGTVWWEGELFAGRPNWKKLFGFPAPRRRRMSKRFSMGRPKSYVECSTIGTSLMFAAICRPRRGVTSRPRVSSA